MDCVYHHHRPESNPRDFFKVALFFRAGKESVENGSSCGLCVSSYNARAQAEPYHVTHPPNHYINT